MRRVLVTGGAGFIGSAIVRALLARDDVESLVVADSLASGKQDNLRGLDDRLRLETVDVRDFKTLEPLFAGIDTVFHEAAVASVPRSIDEPDFCFDVNLTGTHNVLRAAVEHKARRLVFASSSSVYGDSPESPKVETMPLHPKSPYAAHKLAGEALLQAFQHSFGLETVSLRYFNVFGPRQDPSSDYSGVLSIFVDRALAGKAPAIHGDGEQSRDFIYVDDIAALNVLAATAPQAAGRVYNGGRGERTSLNRAWAATRQATGVGLEASHGPERTGDVRHSLADISAARGDLAFEPRVSFEEGLRRTVEWRRSAAP